jgi:hypothetical protein
MPPAEPLRAFLPPDTAATWRAIAPLVPPDAYLGGGTAIAVHLEHRTGRDLDFFFHHHSADLDELALKLSAAGPFAVTDSPPASCPHPPACPDLSHAESGRQDMAQRRPGLITNQIHIIQHPDRTTPSVEKGSRARVIQARQGTGSQSAGAAVRRQGCANLLRGNPR